MTPTLSQDRPRIGADAFTLEGIMKSLLERNKKDYCRVGGLGFFTQARHSDSRKRCLAAIESA